MAARLIPLLILILSPWPPGASAAQVPGLHEAEVTVTDQSPAAQTQGMQAALRAVLVKLTGDRGAAARGEAAALVRNAPNLVQQFKYRSEQVPADGDGTLQDQLRLWVRFDATALERAMREAGLPLWGSQRPATLLWLGVESGGERSLVGGAGAPGVAAALQRQAERRGLPLVLPLLDLEDSSQVGTAEVWGGAREPVLGASRRYGTEAVLSGTLLEAAPGQWEGRWVLYLGEERRNWSSQGPSPERLMEEGVDWLADSLAARYTRTPGATAESLELVVEGVDSVDHYARVQRYLDGLDVVARWQLKRVEPGRLTFDVTARGGSQSLVQVVGLGTVLQPVADGRDGRYILIGR